MNGTAVIAAAHAIERTTAFRKRFHPSEPPGATVHDAAVEFARAALAVLGATSCPDTAWTERGREILRGEL